MFFKVFFFNVRIFAMLAMTFGFGVPDEPGFCFFFGGKGREGRGGREGGSFCRAAGRSYVNK